ncbi:TRAP transporter large permease [Rhizobium sp. NRK18]|uniref:TRAP transporter large permease n=1 Tax=Rhizobium sp. NRK18 TaxID=2964667 RepID=UPI0021C2DF74|nr:TRAP transporter large permease [Rhizobium sp. NRK18]MCQ2003220.1 TRAP transporter large permease [Rhizobium sp. NRK18]
MQLLSFSLALLTLIVTSMPIGVILILMGIIMSLFWLPVGIFSVIGMTTWETANNDLLIAIPLFIMMGEIMLHSGGASSMYRALLPWLNRLPGSLMHTNIAACTMFAATSGSSVATAATVGTIALPEIKKRGFNERLFLGTLAAGGTLGTLIPPSINMIIYGAITKTSIPKLYLAGFIPGLLLSIVFMATVAILCIIKPSWGGEKIVATWEDRIKGLPNLLPMFFIFLVVIGSIYAGLATPTEASALGIIASLLLSAWNRTLKIKMLNRAVDGTMRSVGMIMFVLIGAYYLNFALGISGFVDQINTFITTLPLPPVAILTVIIVIYLLLGCVLDGISMIVLTVPVTAPAVMHLGYNPVWFGIIVMLVIEAGMITPPIGINCYVVQGIRKGGSLNDVFIGILPFLGSILLVIALLIAFPGIALWLPETFG